MVLHLLKVCGKETRNAKSAHTDKSVRPIGHSAPKSAIRLWPWKGEMKCKKCYTDKSVTGHSAPKSAMNNDYGHNRGKGGFGNCHGRVLQVHGPELQIGDH